jgi:hypothetical protein
VRPTFNAIFSGLDRRASRATITATMIHQRQAAGLIWRTLILLLLLMTLIAPQHAAAQTTPPDPRFGVVEAFVNPEATTEAGAGYTRIILRWDVIQPGGPADWKPANVPDPMVAAELAAGREVVAVLIGTPAWAAAAGAGGDARSVPDMFYWEAFVRRMAQHYRGRIHHWIIWNEPDVWEPNHPGSTWTGTEEDYYKLLKMAYLAIKGVDPEQTVTLAGMTYYWDWSHGRRRYLDRLLDVIAADPEAATHGYYFDAALYHLYFNPQQTVDVLEETRKLLTRHGLADKEIWINETNAPPADDPQEPPWSPARFLISQQEQAAFILQEFALAFSAGAARVEVYKLRNSADHPESIEPFGLLRADDSRRPAFDAYRVATTYLSGFRTARREQSREAVAVTFARDAQTTTVLWNTGRRPLRVTVRAIAPEGQLVDATGRVTTIRASNGVYRVDLPPAACRTGGKCMIGGAPRLLVEEGPARDRNAFVSNAAR